MPPKVMHFFEWDREGLQLFGEDRTQWRFVCPNCGRIQTPSVFVPFEWIGANPEMCYVSCLGNFLSSERCKFTLNREPHRALVLVTGVTKEPMPVFDFYREP